MQEVRLITSLNFRILSLTNSSFVLAKYLLCAIFRMTFFCNKYKQGSINLSFYNNMNTDHVLYMCSPMLHYNCQYVGKTMISIEFLYFYNSQFSIYHDVMSYLNVGSEETDK